MKNFRITFRLLHREIELHDNNHAEASGLFLQTKGSGERKGVREMVGIVLNAILVIVLAVLLILHVKWNKPKKK